MARLVKQTFRSAADAEKNRKFYSKKMKGFNFYTRGNILYTVTPDLDKKIVKKKRTNSLWGNL